MFLFSLVVFLVAGTVPIHLNNKTSEIEPVKELSYESLSTVLWENSYKTIPKDQVVGFEVALYMHFLGKMTTKDLLSLPSFHELTSEEKEQANSIVTFVRSEKKLTDYELFLQSIKQNDVSILNWVQIRVLTESLNQSQKTIPLPYLQKIEPFLNRPNTTLNSKVDTFLRVGSKLYFGKYLFECHAESVLANEYLTNVMFNFTAANFTHFNADYLRLANTFTSIMLEDFYYLSALATSRIAIQHLKQTTPIEASVYKELKMESHLNMAKSFHKQLNIDSTLHFANMVLEGPGDATVNSMKVEAQLLIEKITNNINLNSADYFNTVFEVSKEGNSIGLDKKLSIIERLIKRGQIEKAKKQLTLITEADFDDNPRTLAATKAYKVYITTLIAASEKNFTKPDSTNELLDSSILTISNLLDKGGLNECAVISAKFIAQTTLLLAKEIEGYDVEKSIQLNERIIRAFFTLRSFEVYGENMLYVGDFISLLFRLQSELVMHSQALSQKERVMHSFFYADINRAQLLNEQLLMHNNLTKVDRGLRAAYYKTDIESEIIRQHFAYSLNFGLVKSYFAVREKRLYITKLIEDQIGSWNNLWLDPNEYFSLVTPSIKKDESIILYTLNESSGRVFLLQSDTVFTKELSYTSSLQKKSNTLTNLLENGNYEQSKPLINELSSILIEPIQHLLKEKVIYVSDTQIDRLPISLLQSENSSPLVDDYKITKTPSIRYYVSPKIDKKLPNKHFVGIAPVEFNKNNYDRSIDSNELISTTTISLPFTKVELEEIDEIITSSSSWKTVFNQYESSLLTYEQAEKANVLQQSYFDAEILHFASHSITDVSSPARSRILLYNKSDERKDLTIREVYYVNLHTELLVLNGCQTGSGKALGGEGIVGLTHAFLTAGVNNIIATYWPINDRVASIILKYFYQYLFEDPTVEYHERNYADYLKRAVSDLRTNHPQYDNPTYWASFYLLTASH